MSVPTTNHQSNTEAALRWIGDLDHPFYADERQRFVWYEASAIGFQLLVMLQFVMAGLAMLIVGRAALPYVAFGLGPVIFTTLVVAGYTRSRRADYFLQKSDLRRSRGFAVVLLMLLYLAGIARIALQDNPEGYDVWMFVGAAVGVTCALLAGFLDSRRKPDADAD